jgi:hypothetical protein
MSRVAAACLAFALALAAALALASCGGSGAKLLPGGTAREINQNLAAVRELAAEGECVDAQDAALEVSTEVEALEGIDAKLKRALQAGAQRLNEVVQTCTETTTSEETEEAPPSTETTTGKPQRRSGKEKHEAAEAPETGPAEPPAESKPVETPPKGEGGGPEEAPESAPEPPSGGIGPGGETGGGG